MANRKSVRAMSIKRKDIVIEQLELQEQGIISYEVAKARIEYFLTGYFWDDEGNGAELAFLKFIKEQHVDGPIINELIHELENIPT